MKKYIIKNCPNYLPEFFYLGACKCEKGSSINGKYMDNCKDITDCLLKQIVEKCKNYKENCKTEGVCLDERLCSTCFLGGANELGEWILDDLEIEEVE